jgi:hypothetical protein
VVASTLFCMIIGSLFFVHNFSAEGEVSEFFGFWWRLAVNVSDGDRHVGT